VEIVDEVSKFAESGPNSASQGFLQFEKKAIRIAIEAGIENAAAMIVTGRAQ
tara:strand:+ start:695 stop:850 length:156 start_codon:yes stop_codon:yes gene_type:complete